MNFFRKVKGIFQLNRRRYDCLNVCDSVSTSGHEDGGLL